MLFNLDNGGFKLKKMELYNWGTFSDRVWDIYPNGKTSLLTGANGSGKTTLVDAISTLLVPPEVRHYNQSSGAEKKRERTEQSYVLGEYGNITDEESSRIKKQSLRNTDSVSILTAIFYDEVSKRTKTLGQIRYFTPSSFNRIYFISDNELSITEDILPFDNRGEYKKRLTDLNSKFYNNFKDYSASFIKHFGLKSSKALNLFSQTVGVKVLGDINDFIRKHMLEEGKAYNKFEGVYNNFQLLLETQLLIERAEKELELLEAIGNSGKRYQETEEVLRALERKLTIFPYFNAKVNLNKLNKEKAQCEKELTLTQGNLIELNQVFDSIKSDIMESEIALSKNKSAEKIRSLEQEIRYLNKEIDQKKQTWKQCEFFFNIVNKALPLIPNAFENEKNNILEEISTKKQELQQIGDKIFLYKTDLMEKKQNKNQLTDEFNSLLNRDSNIPLKNIEIRDSITQGIGIEKESLPFVGECLRVMESESIWELAIEKLLHSFALCLMVDKENYTRVKNYVNNHNLKGKVVFFMVDTSIEYLFKEKPGSESVINKIDIKKNTPFREWLEETIRNKYNFHCTDDLEEFSRFDFALTPKGLIKNKNRHEKDDNPNLRYILGWDNLKKRADLERNINSLSKEIIGIEKNLTSEVEKEKDITKWINAGSSIQGFTFNSIDFMSLEVKLHSIKTEIEKLAESSSEIEFLREKLILLRENEKEITGKIRDYDKKSGALEHRLREIVINIDREELIISSFPSIDEDLLNSLNNDYKDKWENTNSFRDSIQIEFEHHQNKKNLITQALIKNMLLFINPGKAILDKYPSWTDDTRDLKGEIEYLKDFNELYNRVLKNDLPNHKKKFKQFLNKQVLDDMISFNHTLESELKEIEETIRELNISLRDIKYQDNPGTYITLKTEFTRDLLIKEFRTELKNTFADAFKLANSDYTEMELFFNKSRRLLGSLKNDEYKRKKVLDTRNWLDFTAEERFSEDKSLKQVYRNSESLSGGEKAKLAYTILASAIVFQFAIQEKKGESFRFVVVDEAFSKADIKNSKYLMDLFKKLELQLMVITPLDGINIVEQYINSIHFIQKKDDNRAIVINMTIEEYQKNKEGYKFDNSI
jgi:uncharacterized protein YPO0396